MKITKLLSISALIVASAVSISARTTLDVRGVVYDVDTIFHAKVGPGTTQTQLQLSSGSLPLRVFYLTIDKTTPGVSIRSVCATDKVAGTARTSTMAQSKSKDGLTYFAGVNADFFTTSGSATNGTSKVGSPTTSCTVDREIYKTSNSNYQFSVDTEGVARVCRLNYYTGTATLGDSYTLFKGVNVGAPNNGITIYTPRYWGSANQTDYTGNSYSVTARLADDSDPFYAGGKFKLVVTSDPTDNGDLPVPSNGYVIFGRGTSTTGCNTGAKNFVKNLKTGDVVEFDNIILTPDNEAIHPVTIVSGNPKNVGNGETLDSEGERTDASVRHPRTCIGTSADGNRIIMMVIDGRTAGSVGVTTSMLADVMRYAGAAEAVNLDGGGSSTLYTQALGVRNVCSDGNERAVGNAVFAVLEAPEDSEIAEISFSDYVKTMPKSGIYTPVIYGYNKYGKLIDTDVKGYTLTSDAGSVSADGMTLTAENPGTFALNAEYNGVKTSIVVNVTDVKEIYPRYTDVLLNGTRTWEAQLLAKVDGVDMPLDPAAFEWATADAAVATVNDGGMISGVVDGKTVVSAKSGDAKADINITVEVPMQVFMPVEPSTEAPAWTISSKTAIKSVELTPTAEGFDVVFTQSSTRGPKIGITLQKTLFSHPEAIRIVLDAGSTPLAKMTIDLLAANGARYVSVDKDLAGVSGETEFVIPVSEFFDTDDIGIYPITFRGIGFTPAGVTNTEYTVKVPSIQAKYDEETLSVTEILDRNDSGLALGNSDVELYNLQGVRVTNPVPGIYIARSGANARKILVK